MDVDVDAVLGAAAAALDAEAAERLANDLGMIELDDEERGLLPSASVAARFRYGDLALASVEDAGLATAPSEQQQQQQVEEEEEEEEKATDSSQPPHIMTAELHARGASGCQHWNLTEECQQKREHGQPPLPTTCLLEPQFHPYNISYLIFHML